MKKVSPTKKGFTIIEFSIAIAFIAVLLISIAIVLSNIITIYQKGLTLKAVNSVGRGLVDEFVSGVNGAPSVDSTSLCNSHLSNNKDICISQGARNFIFQHKLGTRAFVNEASNTVQMGGIFCTGKYSYIWNTYYGHESGTPSISLRYSGGQINDFRLIRVDDPTYRVCSSEVSDSYVPLLNNDTSTTTVIDITTLANGFPNIISTPTQGFLSNFDLDLELYEFTMFPLSQDQVTLRSFMSGTFVLATTRGNINITRSGDYCDVHDLDDSIETASGISDLGAEFNYCAINKFNFAARTAGM